MSSPQSFMVGSAPQGASYAGRLMDFGMLSNLGGDYYAGQQARRANAAATAFPNGVPIDPKTGQPDVNAILDTGAKTGGLPFLQGLLPFLMGGEGAPEPGYNTGGATPQARQPQGPAPSTPDQNHPAGASPANLRAASAPNIAAIVSKAGGDPDDPQWATVARRMGVSDVSDPISPQQARLVQGMVARKQPDQAVTQSPLAGDTTETSINGTGTSPRTGEGAGGTVSGAPGPIATPPGSRVAQAFEDSTGGAGTKSVRTQRVPPSTALQPAAEARAPAPPQAGGRDAEPRAPNVPSGMSNDQAIQDLNARAAARRDAAKRIALINPGRAQIIEKQAESLEKQRDAIAEFQGKFRAIEPEKVTEANVKRGAALETSLATTADQYHRIQEPYVQAGKSLMSNPDIYTGFAAGWMQGLNKLRAALGGSVGPAMAQEALKKITASSMLAQMQQMKTENVETGTSAGRVFGAEVDKMNEASPQLEGTPTGIRYLLEMQSRMGERAKLVQRLSQQYLDVPGNHYLDRKFDQWMSKNIPDIFTPQERAYPVLLGAAEIPPAFVAGGKVTPAAAKWVQDMKLAPDDPVRVSNPGQPPKYVHARDLSVM